MLSWPIVNRVSYIPVVFVRARSTSASIGMYSGAVMRSTSSKKLSQVSVNSVSRSAQGKACSANTDYGAESIR